jgi:hypothetical protein
MWWNRAPCVLQRVVVNVTYNPNEALRGFLWAQRGPWLMLRNVEALAPNEAPSKVEGDVVIHVDRVAFMQVVE